MQSVALMIAFVQLVSVGAFAPLPIMNHRSKVMGLRCVSQGSVSPNLVLQPFADKSALKVGLLLLHIPEMIEYIDMSLCLTHIYPY